MQLFELLWHTLRDWFESEPVILIACVVLVLVGLTKWT
jgi:hypothetical protein